jgi:hypothetical protein
MKVINQNTVINKVETTTVELEDGRTIFVINYINEKNKVDDTRVQDEDGNELEYEGTEGQLREDVEKLVEDYVKEQEKKQG